jgi:hypothetical protein
LQSGGKDLGASVKVLERTLLRTFEKSATPGARCHLNHLHQVVTDPSTQLGKGAGFYHSKHRTHFPLHPPGGETITEAMEHYRRSPGLQHPQQRAATPVVMRDRALYDQLVARSYVSAIW